MGIGSLVWFILISFGVGYSLGRISKARDVSKESEALHKKIEDELNNRSDSLNRLNDTVDEMLSDSLERALLRGGKK